MDKFIINGNSKLSGTISVNGAKNSALKILSALILSKESCTITNFPFIEDTLYALELLKDLGAKVVENRKTKTVEVDPSSISKTNLDPTLVRRVRTSIMLAGPMLARFGTVQMDYPGGCVLGRRPVDLFLDGYECFGAKIEHLEEGFSLSGKLKGTNIFFPQITVTGTEAMMITAVLAEGKTILQNCAC